MTTATGIGPLDQVSLLCRDLDRSRRFYGGVLGLRSLGQYGDLAFFDMGGVRLYLHRVPDDAWRPGSVLYFTTNDIEGRAASLAEAGVVFTGQPHVVHRDGATGEETWMAFFDPDGNTLALSSRGPGGGSR